MVKRVDIRGVNIQAELADLPVLRVRGPETTAAEADAAFAELAGYREGGIFAGSFEGQSPWERHRMGDELVQILAGETDLTIMAEDGPETLHLTAGMLTVVPKGCWHRFNAPNGVTVLTATPQPTDHVDVDDPREID